MKLVLGGLATLGLVGLLSQTPAVTEYITVGKNRVVQGIEQGIPKSVEFERLQVVLDKLNAQEPDHKRLIAAAQIELQDAETALQQSQLAGDKLRDDMRRLRALAGDGEQLVVVPASSGKAISTSDVRRALAARLASYKQAQERLELQRRSLAERREAFASLQARFEEWRVNRSQLADRLQTLRLRHESQLLANNTDSRVFDDSDLTRATEIANRLERDLRIVEAQQALGSDAADSILNSTLKVEEDFTAIDAEIDQILAVKTTGCAK